MAYPYTAYQNPYYPPYQPPMPDQLAQLRQQQQYQMMQNQPQMAPQMQTAQSVNPVANQQNGIIWIGSKTEADNYLVAPNSAVALWDLKNPIVYLRQADSTGKPSTKVYELVERTEGPATPSIAPSCQITREEFDDVLNRLTALENKPCKCEAKKTEKKAKEETENG